GRLSPRLFDRYLLREFAGPFGLALCAVTVLMLSDLLFTLADWLLVKRAPAGTIFRLVLYRLPGLLVQAIPLAALAGALLALYRLARDSELLIMVGSGLSLRRLTLPLLAATLLLSAASYAVNEGVVPRANHAAENIVRRLVFQDASPEIQEGIFFRGQDNTVFYVRRFDRAHLLMQDVMVFRTGEGPYPQVVTARSARYGKGVWLLQDGVSRELDQEGFVTNEARFSRLELRVDEGLARFFGEQKTTQEMSREELAANIRLFGRGGVDIRPFLVDYYLKLALPFADFFFLLLGVPVALWVLRRPRRPRVAGIGAAVGLALSYYVVTPFCRSLGVNGFLPPLAAAWLPSLGFAALGLLFYLRLEKV
ncbi:MAG TPA: YjgP/YjgQ family permease, partial [Firmicutes bacterium]|nr:YjgP/YjgQ family permease [Bacillota bacterium]